MRHLHFRVQGTFTVTRLLVIPSVFRATGVEESRAQLRLILPLKAASATVQSASKRYYSDRNLAPAALHTMHELFSLSYV